MQNILFVKNGKGISNFSAKKLLNEMLTFKTLYEPDMEKIEYVLGAIDESQIPKEMYPNYSGNSLALERLDNAWRSHEAKGFKPWWFTPINGKNCEDICRVFGIPFGVGDSESTYMSVQERVYSNGKIALNNIWLFDENKKLVGAISLGLNKKPVFYIELDYKLENDNLKNIVSIYDREFSKLITHKVDLVKEISKLADGVRNTVSIDDLEAGQGVILCEPIKPKNQDWLFRGPHDFDTNTLKGSLFGWQKNNSSNPIRAFFGHKANFFTNHYKYGENGVSHGTIVSKVMQSIFRDIKITPSSFCFEKFGNVLHIARHKSFKLPTQKQKIKVINASYGLSGNGKIGCKQRMYEDFPNIEEKLLYVIAAGNNGKLAPNLCPQHLKGFSSIVVAGTDNSDTDNPTLVGFSNYGEDFADIAADYHSIDKMSKGTSFSAPRVAGYAAKIAHSYPYLLPQDIRLAILTTAYIPQNKLPVRTGGVLRGDRALEMAKCLHEDNAINRKNGTTRPITREQAEVCLKNVTGFNTSLAKTQLDFLQSRPLIFDQN